MIRHVQNLQWLFRQRVISSNRIRPISTNRTTQAKTPNATPFPKGTEGENETPIKFFGSGAANWRAKDTRSGGSDEALWYQPYVVSGSVAIFLIYFCILREESDIDRKLEGSLFDHIEGLEEQQLVVTYKYNLENGLDNSGVEKRLKEVGVDIKELL